MKAQVSWSEDYKLEAIAESGYKIKIGSANEGEEYEGFSPKSLLLYGLAGCTMIDVVMILKKSRRNIKKFNIIAESELVGNTPKIFKYVLLKFYLWGDDLDENLVKRAIELSLEKYCGVSKMLEKAITIDYRVYINSNSES
jgi:putative redox protein